MPISVPKFITRAWASLGSKFDIPENADPLTGKAGYSQGFGPVNLTPVEAGGIPPWGQDMNGILFDLSSSVQYSQAGRAFPFNQDFASAIGGYEIGDVVTHAGIKYESIISGNSVAPPSDGWIVAPIRANSLELKAGADNAKFATPFGLKDAGLWPLGVGQTWQKVSGSRIKNTKYTNTTGRPIFVAISLEDAGDGVASVSVDNVVVGISNIGAANVPVSSQVSFIVPASGVYEVVAGVPQTIQSWAELR